jgi:hypothetical protein
MNNEYPEGTNCCLMESIIGNVYDMSLLAEVEVKP